MCKIKGFQDLLLGADGNQYLCYSQNRYTLTPSKNPCGGGFAVERYTLQWLYDQWRLRQNIWTKPNTYKDLCRFIKLKLTLYRHPKVDFIFQYNRQPPYLLDKFTYMQYHPYMLLQSKHIKIIPSATTNPRGKTKVKVLIKPPKQMLSKWFFQKQFSGADLVQVAAAACSLNYPRLGCCNENRIINLLYINPYFYSNSDWAQTKTPPHYYQPYANIAKDLYFWTGPPNKPIKTCPEKLIGNTTTTTSTNPKYYQSINWNGGYFSPQVLPAWKITHNEAGQEVKPLPLAIARYNPAEDDGKGNEIWVASIMGGHFEKPAEDNLNFNGFPLWLAFWGYWSYLEKVKDKSFFSQHMFVVKSPYIHPGPTEGTKNYYPLIDRAFTEGKNNYDSYVTTTQKSLWYPTCFDQIVTINNICKCGPYVPKLENDRESTWELPLRYIFTFKWGGPHVSDHIVENPKYQPTYDVPDHLKQNVQITDPVTQKAETMFHAWDYRRGCITPAAIKRVSENLETDSSLESDSDQSTQKKRKRVDTTLHHPEEKTKKIKKCLLSLCEETTYQEEETPQNLFKLIKQQQQQQQQLKLNLLTLIQEMKERQQILQLQTGIFE